jgi:hypothetical protein
MDASALSAFASARGGAVGATLRTRNRKGQTHAPRNGVSRRAMAYLRVEKPCFLFLEGSAGAEATVDASTVAPPDASAARAGTSAACVASSVDRSAADTSAPAPGACSFAASAALGEGGVGSHLSGGPPRHFPPPLLPPMTSTPTSPGEKVPAARAAGTLRLSAPGAPGAGSPAPSYAPPAPVPAATPRALGLGVWAGRTAQRSRPPSAREDETSESRRHMPKE